MPWAEINDTRMYFESHGEGEAIVFAHGAGGNHLSWWQQVPHFRAQYRCVTFDHRGFGRTADVEGGPGRRAYPEDLRALMDHLGIERAYLVAQSMGGSTCMGFTMAYPQRVRALVMADTTGTMTDPGLDERRRSFREANPRLSLDEGAYNPALRKERPQLAFLYDSIRALNPPRQQPTPGAPADLDERHVATTARLAALKVPVLFIAGAQDALVPPHIIKEAASLVPGSRFFEAPGCGHSVYFEDAPAFNRVVGDFFAEVRGRGAP